MKIGIDARMYGTEQATGIGQYIKQLTDHLFQIESNDEFVMFMREPEFSQYQPPHNRVKKVKVTPRWYSYGEQWKLPFSFIKESVDLMHFPHFNSPLMYRGLSICTIHDVTPFHFPGHRMKSKIRQWGYRTVFTKTVKKAHTIIAISKSTKDGIIKSFNIPENRIKVIYEGVDDRFQKITKNAIIEEVTQRYRITKPYLFYVGVWRNHKNLENLIVAFNRVKESHGLDIQLVLGGQEDPHYPNIRREINTSPFKHDIITPGYIANNDLASLYNGAMAFAVPSFIEGFGLIGIEAQACGTPVIASNTTSLPEILGDGALYFNPHKPQEIAARIEQVIHNKILQKDLQRKGYKNVARFSWETCAKQTQALYHEALTQNHAKEKDN